MQESAAAVLRMASETGADVLDIEFGRIEAALARVAARGARDERVEALEAALAAERDLVAQLQDRLGILRRRGEAAVARAEAEREEARAALAEAHVDLRRALALIEALRASSAELRKACEARLPEGVEIDAAMRAELEALAAAREADRREVDAALDALRPLLEGA